jgi:hypothetical protein
VPAVARSLAGLRRTGALEVAAGAGVLLLTAALVNAVPPASAGPSPEPDSESLVAQGHDFGTSVRVRLEVTPGRAGSNDFGATVNDFDSGAPVVATSVSLRFSLVSSTAVPPSRLDLTATPSGAFAGSGGNLGLDGIWRITAVVTTDEGAVEVPLVVATRVPALTVTSDPSIEPIIYTVQLPDVGSVQLYLDPGRVGSNGLHVTFFDTAGTGLPVSRIALAVLRPDGSGELLDARALEPGHFVGSVELDQAVPVRVDVAGVAPDGASFHVSLEMEVSA